MVDPYVIGYVVIALFSYCFFVYGFKGTDAAREIPWLITYTCFLAAVGWPAGWLFFGAVLVSRRILEGKWR